jgi:hypothetical protein
MRKGSFSYRLLGAVGLAGASVAFAMILTALFGPDVVSWTMAVKVSVVSGIIVVGSLWPILRGSRAANPGDAWREVR